MTRRFTTTVGWGVLLVWVTIITVGLEVRVITRDDEPIWMSAVSSVLVFIAINLLVMFIRSVAALIREDARSEAHEAEAKAAKLLTMV